MLSLLTASTGNDWTLNEACLNQRKATLAPEHTFANQGFLNLETTGTKKKKHNWAPGAKMFPIHTDLIHSSSYQICPDQAEVELLEPQASGPIPQTAGLKGKKRQLYRAVEV